MGETIELTISLSGPVKSIASPTLPDLSNFDVYSSGTSSNISIVPGAISYQTEYTYTLVPRKVGDFIIGPAKVTYKGKTYSTQPVKIKVTPPAQNRQMTPPQSTPSARTPKPAQAGEDFFIEQSVDRTRPYVGQQVTMVFRFYQGQNLYEQPTLRWPDYNGFWVEDLPPQKTYNKYINGRSYRVTEIRKALFPTVTGKLQIDPTVLTIPPDAFSFFFDNDPFNFFSRRSRRPMSEKVLRTDKIVLDVQALPTNKRPANFSGAVGNFDLKLSLDKDTLEVDQPVTLKAVLSGTGNIKKLPAIEIPELDNFRLYDSGSNDNISKNNYTVSGSKSFEWVLIPTAPGRYDLPELSFTCFDPWRKNYITLSRKPGMVFVKPTSTANLPPGDRPINIIPAGKASLNYIVTDLSAAKTSTPLYAVRWLWGLQLLPLIWLAYLTIATERRKKLEGNLAYARRKLASKAAIKALKAAREAKPDQFYGHVFNGITGFIADKLNENTAGLTNVQIIELLKKTGKCDQIIEEFSSFLGKCDAGRFAPGSPAREEIDAVYAQAETLLSELGRKLR